MSVVNNNIFGGDIRGIYVTDAVICSHYFDGSHFLFHVMAAAKKAAKTTSGNA